MNKDLTAGGAVAVLGVFYGGYAWSTLPIGTVRQMGPGAFPLGLGLLMAAIGIGILLPGLRGGGDRPPLPIRGIICSLCAVAAFALLIRPAGLFPAVVATTALGALSLPAPSLRMIAGLSAMLCLLTWALFILLLNIPVSLAAWPF
jgi:hypothetical protein